MVLANSVSEITNLIGDRCHTISMSMNWMHDLVHHCWGYRLEVLKILIWSTLASVNNAAQYPVQTKNQVFERDIVRRTALGCLHLSISRQSAHRSPRSSTHLSRHFNDNRATRCVKRLFCAYLSIEVTFLQENFSESTCLQVYITATIYFSEPSSSRRGSMTLNFDWWMWLKY